MQKVIDQITDHLVGLIKNDQPSYTPKELLKAGIPLYIVERIRLTLEDRIADDLQKPDSKWFSFENELVLHSWEDFVISATSSSTVPHDEVYNVLHHVIGEIISVFLEPRKKMASYLFREDRVLNLEEATKRSARLTIYKHFGKALPLYMQKKGLQEISIERCEQLIKNLDERLVAGYTAEDWAQKLELLFTLFGGKVEPYLLRIFFEDKGLYNAAETFAHIDVPLTKSTFIEILSSKDLVDLTGSAPKSSTSESSPVAEKIKPAKKSTSKSSKAKGKKEEVEEDRPMNLADIYATEAGISDDEMNDILSDIALGGVIEVDNIEQAESLNALFESTESETESDEVESTETGVQNEEMKEFRDNLTLILDQAKHSFENVVNESSDEDDEGIDVSVTDDDIFGDEEKLFDPVQAETVADANIKEEKPINKEEEVDTEAEGEEKPMWAQFLNEDQMAVLMGKRSGTDEEAVEGNGNENAEASEVEEEKDKPKPARKPAATKKDKPSTQVPKKAIEEKVVEEEEGLIVEDEDDELFMDASDSILDRFAESRSSYVSLPEFLEPRFKEWKKEIFKGSKSKLEKALNQLEEMNTWDEASAFLQNDVFEKNSVDMFSEIAIDFTDRLHTYFKEYKS